MFRTAIPFVRTRSNVFANIGDGANNPRSEIVRDETKTERPRIVAENTNEFKPQNEDVINYGQGRIFNLSDSQPFPQTGGTAFSNIVEDETAPTPAVESTAKTADTSQRPLVEDKIESEIARKWRLMNDENYRNAPENKPNRWLAGAAIAMKNVGDMLMSGRSWGEALGAGIGGFGGGAIFPKAFADMKHANRLEVLYKLQTEKRKEDDRQLANKAKAAQIYELQRKPEKEAAERQAKFNSEAQKQINRLQVLLEKDKINDANFKGIITRNGKFFKQMKSGEEIPLVNPTTGEQETDLLNTPIETMSENGTKGYTTFGKILSADASKNYRDAMMGFTADRYNNDNSTEYSNKYGELSGKITGATSRITSLQQRLNQLRSATGLEKFQAAEEIPTVEKELMDAQAEKAQYETQLKNLKKPTQVSVGGKYSGQVFPNPASLKPAFPEKSDAQIRRIIEANGGRFQQ